MSDITIAYPVGDFGDDFISRKAYESDFVGFLTEYVSILKLPIKYIEEGCEFDPDPDYLLVNIDTWGLKLFLLREQGKIDTPFLIHFHVIYSQHIYISYLLPLLREEDIVVVGSRYSKKCLLNISDVFDVPVIPLSLDVEEIADISARNSRIPSNGKASGKKKIAYLGQLIQEKGIGELIECMPEILDKMKGEITLDVIGPLSGRTISNQISSYVKGLRKRTEELGISRYINWTGVLMGEEKYHALSQSDIFINPSLFKIETFGVVNTEALACGLPVVCTNWSAFSEIITDGKNGFLVDVEETEDYSYKLDRRQLISRVTELLNDNVLLAKMKEEARKDAHNYHCLELVPRLIRLLKKKKVVGKRQWRTIKNKTFLDFCHLFKKDWLKVIGADRINYKTYEEMVKSHGPEIKFSFRMRHEAFKYLSGR